MRTLIGKSKAGVVIVSSLSRGESCRVAVTLRSSGTAAVAAGGARAAQARRKNRGISRGEPPRRPAPGARTGRSAAGASVRNCMNLAVVASLDGLETLRVTAEGAVGSIVLDRPAKLNAMSRAMLQELVDAAGWFDAQREVKVVVVRGEGRAFSAGADLNAMGGDDGSGRAGVDLGRRMAEAVAEMRAMTIAAIHGHCVGGALVLATACDLRVAADDA